MSNVLWQVEHELMMEKIRILVAAHEQMFGSPCAGSTCDLWSLKSCRETFACLRGSFVLDGDVMAKQLPGLNDFKGKLVDMSPIMAFQSFPESRHTGNALARWKKRLFEAWQMQNTFGVATEDGASPNKLCNRILNMPMIVCYDHDIARAVLYASGEEGKPSRNAELKAFINRSSKQSGSFHRSVVANTDLQQAVARRSRRSLLGV